MPIEMSYLVIGLMVLASTVIFGILTLNMRLAKRRIGAWTVDRGLYFFITANLQFLQSNRRHREEEAFVRARTALNDAQWIVFRRFQMLALIEIGCVFILMIVGLSLIR